MEESDLDEESDLYVIRYKNSAGIKEWCENEAAPMEEGWGWD